MFPVEAFRSTLDKVVRVFGQLGIRFHLTGGLTTALYGEPRMTQDIDIVVDPEALAAELESFIGLLHTSDFMFDETSLRSAVEKGDLFQLLDEVEVLKLDIYPRELIAGELDRSCAVEVFEGVELPVVSRSDAAGAKLVWISRGSHKSRRDLRQMFRSSSTEDRLRIRELAERLALGPLLAEVLDEPDEIT
jgi:hypothetical protein